MDGTSRVIRRRYEHVRDAFENEGTIFSALPAGSWGASIERAYSKTYSHLRELCLEHRKPGLLLAAVGDDVEPHGSVWLGAKEAGINAAIVGRHTVSDLFLPIDPSLSLRHLAVLVLPRSSPLEGRFRVLDLRTGAGFHDERRRSLSAIEADGPVFIRCGSIPIVAFPTPSPEALWPADGTRAWARLPERTYLQSRTLGATGARENRDLFPRAPSSGRPEETLVFTSEGPVLGDVDLRDANEPAAGQLHLESEAGSGTMTVGRRAARRGILLGRSERCHSDAARILSAYEGISRVHVLILDLGGAMYAVDTASSNGVFEGSRRVRVLRLATGRTLALGTGIVRVEWRPAH